MKRSLALLSLLMLSACSVYKIEPVHNFQPRPNDRPISRKPTPEPVRLNSSVEGAHCFEPMFYVLSLGIIPSHCVGYYQAGHGVFRVTSMAGWIPAMYPVFSDWKYDLDGNSDMRTLQELGESANGNHGGQRRQFATP